MDAIDLAETIQAAQGGDGSAYERLVDVYGRRIYGFLYRLTGDRQDAEDLLQEVFVRVVRNIGHYRHQDNFDAWLFRIATNLVRDGLRRRKRRPLPTPDGLGEEDRDDPLARAQSREPDPRQTLEHAEQVDRMQRAIAQLPPQDREVILLRHFSQLSFRQIAELLGCPLGTALARGHRSLAKLRLLMQDHEQA